MSRTGAERGAGNGVPRGAKIIHDKTGTGTSFGDDVRLRAIARFRDETLVIVVVNYADNMLCRDDF